MSEEIEKTVPASESPVTTEAATPEQVAPAGEQLPQVQGSDGSMRPATQEEIRAEIEKANAAFFAHEAEKQAEAKRVRREQNILMVSCTLANGLLAKGESKATVADDAVELAKELLDKAAKAAQ